LAAMSVRSPSHNASLPAANIHPHHACIAPRAEHLLSPTDVLCQAGLGATSRGQVRTRI
jgi:hypothetical protein